MAWRVEESCILLQANGLPQDGGGRGEGVHIQEELTMPSVVRIGTAEKSVTCTAAPSYSVLHGSRNPYCAWYRDIARLLSGICAVDANLCVSLPLSVGGVVAVGV